MWYLWLIISASIILFALFLIGTLSVVYTHYLNAEKREFTFSRTKRNFNSLGKKISNPFKKLANKLKPNWVKKNKKRSVLWYKAWMFISWPVKIPYRIIMRITWSISKKIQLIKRNKVKGLKTKVKKEKWWKRFKNWIKKLLTKKHTKKDILEAIKNGEEINASFAVQKALHSFQWHDVVLTDTAPIYKIKNKESEKELKKAKIQLIALLESWTDDFSDFHNIELNDKKEITKIYTRKIFWTYVKEKLLVTDKIMLFKNAQIVKENNIYKLEIIEENEYAGN